MDMACIDWHLYCMYLGFKIQIKKMFKGQRYFDHFFRFAVLIDLCDILDVRKEGHTMVSFYMLFGNFLSHSFIVRITFGGISLRGPLDLS